MAVDYPRALAAYKIGAEGGNAHCQNQLGWMYQHGEGIDSPDYKQALMWFEIGAEGGDAGCQYHLGWMYQYGLGMDSPDYKQALVWFEKASSQDDPDAVSQLGLMASNGFGQTPSWRRAREHWQRASDLGNQRARENMHILREDIQMVTRSPLRMAFAAPPFPQLRPTRP